MLSKKQLLSQKNINTLFVSKTDTNAQSLASNLTVGGGQLTLKNSVITDNANANYLRIDPQGNELILYDGTSNQKVSIFSSSGSEFIYVTGINGTQSYGLLDVSGAMTRIDIATASGKPVKIGGKVDIAGDTTLTTGTFRTSTVTLASGNATFTGTMTQGQGTTASGANSYAQGLNTTAGGASAHAEGSSTSAFGDSSHAEGYNTQASGSYGHAEGHSTIASNTYTHAEGYTTTASAIASHAEGSSTSASGDSSHAEGYNTQASGSYSHAEGSSTIASNMYAHAEGYTTTASAIASHAEGYNTKALKDNAHAEGNATIASGNAAHAEGGNTKAFGTSSHAEGSYCAAYGDSTHAEGLYTTAWTNNSHAEGEHTLALSADVTAKIVTFDDAAGTLKLDAIDGFAVNDAIVIGCADKIPAEATITAINNLVITIAKKNAGDVIDASWRYVLKPKLNTQQVTTHAEGNSTLAAGDYSHAEGVETSATGFASHAEGYLTRAWGHYSHAEGDVTEAFGFSSHTEGRGTTTYGAYSHAEGRYSTAKGDYSHAEGYNTYASGVGTHAEGTNNTAKGDYSHVEGGNTYTETKYAHAEGFITLGFHASLVAKVTAFTSSSFTLDTVSGFAVGDVVYAKSGGANYNFTISAIDTNTRVVAVTSIDNYTVDSGMKYLMKKTTDVSSQSALHAEGHGSIAAGTATHAEGYSTMASGWASHAEGDSTYASGTGSHAEGVSTQALGYTAHAEGSVTLANGNYSHAEGHDTSTNLFAGAHIMGQFGNSPDAYSWALANGSSLSAKGLASKIMNNGYMYADGPYSSAGADYAEMFETLDGKTIEPGYFITLEADKVRIARAGDTYILGITSANPSIIGNNSELNWKDRFLRDEWGQLLYEEVQVPAQTITNEQGQQVEVVSEYTLNRPKENPEWNPQQEYLPREKRLEWVTVGLLGQLRVREDGTCVVNGYCKPNDQGIATKAEDGQGYRVMKRMAENIILVLVK